MRKLNFKVQLDLMEYKIRPEVAQIKKAFRRIYHKSNETAVLDVLQDIHDTLTMTGGDYEYPSTDKTNKGGK